MIMTHHCVEARLIRMRTCPQCINLIFGTGMFVVVLEKYVKHLVLNSHSNCYNKRANGYGDHVERSSSIVGLWQLVFILLLFVCCQELHQWWIVHICARDLRCHLPWPQVFSLISCPTYLSGNNIIAFIHSLIADNRRRTQVASDQSLLNQLRPHESTSQFWTFLTWTHQIIPILLLTSFPVLT